MARTELEALYHRCRPTLTAALTRLVGPSYLDQVEAMVQETFVAALRAWPFQKPPDNPDGWLMAVAKNRALDWLRTEGRRARDAAGGGGEGEEEHEGHDPLAKLAAPEEEVPAG